MSDGITAIPKTDSTSTTQSSEPAVVKDDTAPLQRYFGVDGDSEGKLKTIYETLRSDKPEYNEIDLLTDLRGTIQKLGAPALGESVLDMVYRYSKIQNQINSLQMEQKDLIR